MTLLFAPPAALWWYSSRRGRTAFATVDSPYPRRKRDVALGTAFRVAIIPALGNLVSILGRVARKNDFDEETAWTCGTIVTGAFLVFCILPFCIAIQGSYQTASRAYRAEETP